MKTLNVNEIFTSISGEVNGFKQGVLTTFVRLAGCNLSCPYCDAPDSQSLKHSMQVKIDDIIELVRDKGNKHVCITGGEPLIYTDTYQLIKKLVMEGYCVILETNGTINADEYTYMANVSIVMDFKLEMAHRVPWENFRNLRKQDVIKFVFSDLVELKKSISTHDQLLKVFPNLKHTCFAYSPVLNNPMEAEDELDYNKIIAELTGRPYNTVFSLQIHKFMGVA